MNIKTNTRLFKNNHVYNVVNYYFGIVAFIAAN